MRISVKGKPQNALINTVVLTHNYQDPINVYLFRCHSCGNAINQIQGHIWSISAGYIPTREVTTISRCFKCHENYTFQTFDTFPRKTPDVTLVLSVKPKMATFHCIKCQQPLVQYNYLGAALLPQFSWMRLPSDFLCFTCQASYYLSDLVEPDGVEYV